MPKQEAVSACEVEGPVPIRRSPLSNARRVFVRSGRRNPGPCSRRRRHQCRFSL